MRFFSRMMIGMVSVSCICGCAEESRDPNKSHVSGTVTLDGAPLEAGHLQLVYFNKPTMGAIAVGITDVQGRYELNNVTPGRYKVVIRKDKASPDEPEKYAMPPDARPSILSPIYSDVRQTELSVELQAGEQTQDFALKSESC